MRKIAKLLILAFVISLIATACGAGEAEVFDEDFENDTGVIDLSGLEVIYKVVVNSSITSTVLGYEVDS